jgi:hypothetical protein
VTKGFYRELEAYSKVRLTFFTEYEKQMRTLVEALGIGSNLGQIMR